MSIDRTRHDKLHSIHKPLIPQSKLPIPLPNVPLINLPHLPRSNSWSFIRSHKLSDYFTSKAYLNDALNVSLRIPITHPRRISCSIDTNYLDQYISLKNIKQIIFNNHFKLNQKCTCPKPHIHFNNKSKKKKSIPIKKLHHTSPRHFLPKKHRPTPSISSHQTTPSSPPNTKSQINPPVNITSHTRFGRSILALHFQKYRFISPIETTKKHQFLQLLKLSKKMPK